MGEESGEEMSCRGARLAGERREARVESYVSAHLDRAGSRCDTVVIHVGFWQPVVFRLSWQCRFAVSNTNTTPLYVCELTHINIVHRSLLTSAAGRATPLIDRLFVQAHCFTDGVH